MLQCRQLVLQKEEGRDGAYRNINGVQRRVISPCIDIHLHKGAREMSTVIIANKLVKSVFLLSFASPVNVFVPRSKLSLKPQTAPQCRL